DSEDGQLNLVMAQDLTDLNSIAINNGGPVIDGDGIDMNDNRITNLTPGEEGTDAVNVDQQGEASEVANPCWNVSTKGEDGTANVGPGGTVAFSNDDGNIVIDREGTDLAFDLNPDLDVDSVTTGNTVMNNDGLVVNDNTDNPTATT